MRFDVILTSTVVGDLSKVHISQRRIMSNLCVKGAVKIINDQECLHVTGRFQSIRILLSKQTGWPVLAQLHPSIKTVG